MLGYSCTRGMQYHAHLVGLDAAETLRDGNELVPHAREHLQRIRENFASMEEST